VGFLFLGSQYQSSIFSAAAGQENESTMLIAINGERRLFEETNLSLSDLEVDHVL